MIKSLGCMKKNNTTIPIPEKKAAVYKAVVELYNEGKNFSNMTVSEIALRAGIGKGTVYEYFTKKEDLVKDALTYECLAQAEAFANYVLVNSTFDGICYAMMDWLELNREKNLLFQKIMLARYTESINEVALELLEYLALHGSLDKVIDTLIQTGIQEGIIQKPKHDFMKNSALMMFLLFPHYLNNRKIYETLTLEEAKTEIRNMFVKMLNP